VPARLSECLDLDEQCTIEERSAPPVGSEGRECRNGHDLVVVAAG